MNSLHTPANRAKHLPHSRRQQFGIAAVEFTITLPLLLFLLFVSAEVGRLLFQYNTLTKAVEDGARYLAGNVRAGVATDTLAATVVNAENLVRYGSLTGTTALLPGPGTVTVATQTSAAGTNPIIVTATYTYDPMIFPDAVAVPFWQNIQLAIPLTAVVSMPIL